MDHISPGSGEAVPSQLSSTLAVLQILLPPTVCALEALQEEVPARQA